MAADKPHCQAVRPWLRGRLTTLYNDRSALGALTGQDSRALSAFVHLVALYGSSDGDGQREALNALHHCVRAMQPSTRHIAKHAIPYVLDWSDEEPLWSRIAVDRWLSVTAVAEGRG